MNILSFLIGIVAVQQWARLPNSGEYTVLLLLAAGVWRLRYWRLLGLLLGLLWASCIGQWRLAEVLPSRLQGEEITLQGYVASLPRRQEHRLGFDFVVTQSSAPIRGKVHLNWYSPEQPVRAGQSWRLVAKLKSPHARLNSGGFDYQAWLFANRIVATGYVRSKPAAVLLPGQDAGLAQQFAAWRQQIADRLDVALPNSSQLAVIKALTIGS